MLPGHHFINPVCRHVARIGLPDCPGQQMAHISKIKGVIKRLEADPRHGRPVPEFSIKPQNWQKEFARQLRYRPERFKGLLGFGTAAGMAEIFELPHAKLKVSRKGFGRDFCKTALDLAPVPAAKRNVQPAQRHVVVRAKSRYSL